ncbi:ABC transporter permease [Halodesulfurarchaeum sp.]|uniref:ABC transporter permease n=1 Tax=Halodesulfurarchaeum sp. TaxID=1980530 RepID=UPI002FC2B6BF
MMEIMKYEARQRVKGTVTLLVIVSFYLFLLVWMFPSIEASGEAFTEYAQSMPESLQAAFAVESITTIGGFLAAEIYQFIWILMLGLYFTYLGGGLIADDIESGRIDLLLATPVSRVQIVVEKYLSLMVPILAINILMPVVVLVAVHSIGESLPVSDVIVLHVLSVPYLLVAAAIGLLLSVFFDRSTIPQRVGLGVLFGLFTLETVTVNTDIEWLGALSPTRYYDPAAIIVDGEYDIAGALVLLATTLLLVIASAEWFRRRDV